MAGKIWDKPIIDQLRLHKPEETSGVCSRAIQEIERLTAQRDELLAASNTVESFIAVMFGSGADAVIPETVTASLGVPVKLGEIVRELRAAIAKATNPAPASR